MKPRTLTRLPIVLLAILATAPGYGQVYKWIDERGVTNYSSELPADPKARTKVKVIEDTMSVYTPPKAVTQAIDSAHERRRDPLADKVDSLERQLEAERRARQDAANAAAEAQAAAAESAATRIYSGTWYPPGAFVLPLGRQRTLPQAQLKPGTTAGNVVGPGGYIPGNSAAAPPMAPPVRSRRPAPGMLRDNNW